ncbi:MAG TPA: SpoIIE family protein phosphatase [Candidatus Baltobacteraceae bacterium]|jgi:PAS domain S-box-containing protein|nr:SpoIIE family protein phosphatase [Candidatus Baltobacteraceae bacterium]
MTLQSLSFDDIPEIAWTATRDGRMLQFNREWHDYAGVRVRSNATPAALEKAWWAAVHRDDREFVRQALLGEIEAGTPFELELRLRRGDGMDRWFRLFVSPLDGGNGEDAAWLGLCSDIDDYKRQGELFAFLAEASEVLAESLDLQATLNRLLGIIVPEFGDWAAIDLFDDDDRLKTVAAIHADPEKMRLVKRMVGRYTHDRRYEPAIAEALRMRRPMVIRDVNVELLKRAAAPNLFPVIRELGPRSAVTVPLRARGRTIGSLVAYWCETPRRYADTDLPLFEELTKRAAVSIDHARLYEREREIAATFQRAALPISLPEVPGLHFDGIYVPASDRELLGGDWYDALRLNDGRIVISVGDVAGSGLPAAVIMASMRQVIRGVAQVYADPIAMLDAADRTLKTEHPDMFVTAFVGVLDPIARTLTHASAGHPPPFLRDAAGEVTPLGISGLPLGLRERGETAMTTRLPSSGLVVFYSDGLIEVDRDLLRGYERLTAAIARPDIASGVNPAEAIYRAVLKRGGNDDVVVLTLQFEARIEGAVTWSLDTQDADVARATRHAFIDALRDAGVREKQLDAAEHVFGELLGNVVRFAPGPVDIELHWSHGAAPVLHVLDRGPGFTFTPKLPTDLLSERGRGLYIVWTLAADFNVTPRHDGGSHARAVLGTA